MLVSVLFQWPEPPFGLHDPYSVFVWLGSVMAKKSSQLARLNAFSGLDIDPIHAIGIEIVKNNEKRMSRTQNRCETVLNDIELNIEDIFGKYEKLE